MSKILGALAVIAVCIVLLCGGYLGWKLFTAHQHNAQASANIHSQALEIASGAAAGHDAVEAVQSEAASEAASRALTQSNAQAIHSAAGAEVPVQPAAYDAGIHGLCRRVVYRNDPRCVQLRHPSS